MEKNNIVFNLNASQQDNVNITENKLLEALLTKCTEEIVQQKENDGLIKIKLKSPYNRYYKTDFGYEEIEKLVETGNFDSFGSKYCFSLGTIKPRRRVGYTDPEACSYYEVIWDYNTFLEKVNVLNPLSGHDMENDFVISINNFKKLPVKYQILILADFTKIVNDVLSKYTHDIAVDTCGNEGHVFGEWKYKKWTEYIETGIDHQNVTIPIEKENWKRTCSRCGLVEKVESEPQELIDARKEKNRTKRIKRLEKQLKTLKEENDKHHK